ncbi:MAG: diguanylate cyclase [Methyloprofundus sp.]|nr:diguanylate cyclase [Methyloprofundus sp.]
MSFSMSLALLTLRSLCIRGSFVIFLWVFLFAPIAKSEPLISSIVLSTDKTAYSFAGKLAYFKDENGGLSFLDVQQQKVQDSFKLIEQNNLSLGYIRPTIWLKFSVVNNASPDQNWLLVFDYPLLDEIEIFSKNSSGHWQRQLLGDSLPFQQRPFVHRIFVTELNIEQHQYQEFYVRVKTSSSMQIRLLITSTEAFFARELSNEMFYGVIYGIMLLMAVYNLFLYLAVRDKSYLVYIFSVLSGSLFIMALNGHAYQYIWPESPNFANTAIPLSSSLWIVFTSTFTQIFLETKRFAPRLYYAINALIFCAIGSVLFSMLGEYQLAIKLATGLALVNNILILVTSIVCWLNGNRFARFFVAAWSVYGLGVALLILSRYGWLADNFVTHNSAALGLLVEIIMLSLALSDKYRVLTTELASYAQELESKVALRTEELEVSNQQLKDLSLSDSLTGLPNRRHFDQQLKLEWLQLLREAKPLSILVCDVDQFKSINDHYGHQYGDKCLQTIAETIMQVVLRPRDIPARIGGDEFVVLLPDTDTQGAELLAGKISAGVAQAAIQQAPDAQFDIVTLSIGVATLIPDINKNVNELFSLADRHLYQAKENGRNAVVATID